MNNVAFTLRIRTSNNSPLIVVRAYDDLGWDDAGRVKLTVEVRQAGRVIFPKGQLTCAVHGSSDGVVAREAVLSLVAMKPGDTDREYFASYNREQYDWAVDHGDEISMVRELRYCDEQTGAVLA